MSPQTHFDLIVIGSGSAGSACWFAARALGKSVAVFEEDALGGECANFACVPTKALLHAAEVYESVRGAARYGIDVQGLSFDYARVKAWRDEVVSQTGAALGRQPYDDAGVTLVQERAFFTAPGEIEAAGVRYTAERFLIATGARTEAPPIDGLADAGYLTFREAADLETLPGSIFILGGGPVGCEFASLFAAFGVQVYLADHNDRLLSTEDPEAGELLGEELRRRGVQTLLGREVTRVSREDSRLRLTLDEGEVVVDQILIATGKTPNVDLGLEAAGVAYDEGGITVDDAMRTSNPLVFAAGDVAGPYRYTHSASYQGQIASANMFTNEPVRADYRAMPRCVFSLPEVCAIGLTEAEAREHRAAVQVGKAEIIDNDRGLTTDQRRGFVKVIADQDGKLLGGVMVGPRAGEVMHELALAVQLGATSADVAGLIHAFPTFSEALREACANVS